MKDDPTLIQPSAEDAPSVDRESDRRLGKCVRTLRSRAGLSLQDVANRTKLSLAMISQLERGLSTPSIRTLRLLAMALDVPVSYFFEVSAPSQEHPGIVRRVERKLIKLNPTGVIKELLTPQDPGSMDMYELSLPAGSSTGSGVGSPGEKAGLVLEGEVRLWIEQEAFLLGLGDTFRLPGTTVHHMDNPGKAPARMLWISCRLLASPAAGGDVTPRPHTFRGS